MSEKKKKEVKVNNKEDKKVQVDLQGVLKFRSNNLFSLAELTDKIQRNTFLYRLFSSFYEKAVINRIETEFKIISFVELLNRGRQAEAQAQAQPASPILQK